MKYDKFVEEAKCLGYTVEESKEFIRVGDVFGSHIGRISKSNALDFKVSYPSYALIGERDFRKARELLVLITELSMTKLPQRLNRLWSLKLAEELPLIPDDLYLLKHNDRFTYVTYDSKGVFTDEDLEYMDLTGLEKVDVTDKQ